MEACPANHRTPARRWVAPRRDAGRHLALSLVALLGLALAGCGDRPAQAKVDEAAGGEAAPTKTARTIAVRTTPAAERPFEARVTVKGDVQAKNYAFVGAKIPGVLEAVNVDVGDVVTADETILFVTERSKLEKAVEAQRAALALARVGIAEKKAVLAQLQVALDKAEKDYERHRSLRETNTVSQDQFERVETGYRQAKAAARHGAVLVDLAREQKRQAEVALAIAEKDLADTEVRAPISGTVSDRRSEPGETAAPGVPLIRITDTGALRVSAPVPADHYARVVPGETKVRVRTAGADLGALTVTYRAPVIDPKTRTFEVRAAVPAGRDDVAPGALADLELLLEERTGLGVPQAAVLERGGAAVVFVVEDGVARAREVETGLETGGWVELRGDTVAPGAPVISDGQTLVEDGTPVKVLSIGAAPADDAPADEAPADGAGGAGEDA